MWNFDKSYPEKEKAVWLLIEEGNCLDDPILTLGWAIEIDQELAWKVPFGRQLGMDLTSERTLTQMYDVIAWRYSNNDFPTYGF